MPDEPRQRRGGHRHSWDIADSQGRQPLLEQRVDNLERRMGDADQSPKVHIGSAAEADSEAVDEQYAALQGHTKSLERFFDSSPQRRTPAPASTPPSQHSRFSTPEKGSRDLSQGSVQERLSYFESLLRQGPPQPRRSASSGALVQRAPIRVTSTPASSSSMMRTYSRPPRLTP